MSRYLPAVVEPQWQQDHLHAGPVLTELNHEHQLLFMVGGSMLGCGVTGSGLWSGSMGLWVSKLWTVWLYPSLGVFLTLVFESACRLWDASWWCLVGMRAWSRVTGIRKLGCVCRKHLFWVSLALKPMGGDFGVLSWSSWVQGKSQHVSLWGRAGVVGGGREGAQNTVGCQRTAR